MQFLFGDGSVHLISNGTNGLLYGNPKQFVAQVIALLFVLAWDGVMTFAICKAINVFVKLRLPDEDLEVGDVAVHGDVAYELVPQPPRDRVEGPPVPRRPTAEPV